MARNLPLALMDLTLLRLSARNGARLVRHPAWRRPTVALPRQLHQNTSASFDEFIGHGLPAFDAELMNEKRPNVTGLSVRSVDGKEQTLPNPMEELERRVKLLEESIDNHDPTLNAPFYSEAELLGLYEDVLSVPIPEPSVSKEALEAAARQRDEEDIGLVSALEARLCEGVESTQNEKVQRRILVRAHEIVSQVEAARKALALEENGEASIPVPVLTARECQALIRTSLKEEDSKAAELCLQIMKRTNLPLPEVAINDILAFCASQGDKDGADRVLVNYLTERPTEEQRHLHVKAHLKSAPLDVLPISAMELIHHYEGQNLPAPMPTYTLLISSLFSRLSSVAKGQAWDMFMHMRYAAHPEPDQLLYSIMIRACASPISTKYSSEPERALDLWKEMTIDHKIMPSVGSYNAVILACARSGTKTYVNEAFRLAKQMLDSHRDAFGNSAFRPDKKTFCALLEGAKRIGDLGRARWILAELVRGPERTSLEEVEDKAPELDEEVMMHMFHAYASYKPPFLRSATRVVDGVPQANEETRAAESDTVSITEKEPAPSWTQLPPQSRQEVLREAQFLFARILEDTGHAAAAEESSPIAANVFKNVKLTPRLINSYLSIFYKHADLETSRREFWKNFEEFGVQRTLRSYVEALERCAHTRWEQERDFALVFGRELWDKWEAVEAAAGPDAPRHDARLLERLHAAMIRLYAVNMRLDEAMDHLRAFASKYPPQDLTRPPPKHPLQSTRVSLEAVKPLVRMSSPADVPDDHVPPLLMFRDLEILHHRLLFDDRVKDIGYVKWISKAYEWALRVRRDKAVKAKFDSSAVPEVAAGVNQKLISGTAN